MKEKLNALHQSIFEQRHTGLLYPILHELHEIYSSVSGISANSSNNNDIHLPSGKAISAAAAAHCLLEMARTAKFLCGIRQAILQLKKDFDGETIRILYAGTGPYATLVTPLTSIFSPNEITFDFMDINETSLEALQKMYQAFELMPYINSFTLADATQYKIPAHKPPHLMIAETLNAALKNEPQVELTLNLVPQLHNKGIFIPQQIAVDAYLLNSAAEQASFFVEGKRPERIFLGNIYTLSQTNCERHQGTTISIPENRGRNNQLSLLTEITVFGNEILSSYDCSLTLPQKVCNINAELKSLEAQFLYEHGPKPGFKHLITADHVDQQ